MTTRLLLLDAGLDLHLPLVRSSVVAALDLIEKRLGESAETRTDSR